MWANTLGSCKTEVAVFEEKKDCTKTLAKLPVHQSSIWIAL